MTVKVVGITGQAGSGKDECASRFVQEHNYVQIALADPLKRFAKKVFDFTDEQLWGPSEFRNTYDPRYKLYNNKVQDNAWKAAKEASLYHGRYWLAEVLNDDEKAAAQMDNLEKWFDYLGRTYPALSPRIALQALGTELGRELVSEDIWINYLFTAAELIEEGWVYDRTVGFTDKFDGTKSITGVVVSDVRFHNELKFIKEHNGRLVRLERPGTDSKALMVGVAAHASEREQLQFDSEQFDGIIKNTGTLADLKEAVDVLATAWDGDQ